MQNFALLSVTEDQHQRLDKATCTQIFLSLSNSEAWYYDMGWSARSAMSWLNKQPDFKAIWWCIWHKWMPSFYPLTPSSNLKWGMNIRENDSILLFYRSGRKKCCCWKKKWVWNFRRHCLAPLANCYFVTWHEKILCWFSRDMPTI